MLKDDEEDRLEFLGEEELKCELLEELEDGEELVSSRMPCNLSSFIVAGPFHLVVCR